MQMALSKQIFAFSSATVAFHSYMYWKKNSINGQVQCLKQADEKFRLKLVQVVFRHGARTPLLSPEYLPKIEYTEEQMKHPKHTIIPYQTVGLDEETVKLKLTIGNYGTDNHGLLTGVGAEQLYQLGQQLQARYMSNVKFIEDESDVYARSTAIQRTVDSVRCVLAGLFPEQQTAFPIHVAASKSEILYPNFQVCNYIVQLNRWVWKNPDLIKGFKEIREDIQRRLNISLEYNVHLVTLRDCLFVHKFHNMLPPEFNVPDVLEHLDEVSVRIMDYVFAGHGESRDISLKLASGPLLVKLLENMDAKIKGEEKHKLMLFSGHDTTLIPLLHTLNINDSKWPPYGANITFELYESTTDKSHYVKILYQNKDQALPGCSDVMCPLNEFKAAMSKYLVSADQYKQLCNVTDDKFLQRKHQN
nr:lysophosphatidic acid phosphatase type 6-like [Ciona intestinalis]|eukprot:XP_002122434.1 lysophosphatidic acid phosphatase type 6-like [Ciona intestinalis]